MYNFITTARPYYFSKNNDIVFLLGEFFTLKIKSFMEKDNNIQKPIASFVISRKIGNAVVRNKLRRRLRVIFNELSFDKSSSSKINTEQNILSDGIERNDFLVIPKIELLDNNFKQSVSQDEISLYQNLCYILIAKPTINSLSFLELKNKIKIEMKQLFKHKRFVNYLRENDLNNIKLC